jgi:hypothetical protein
MSASLPVLAHLGHVLVDVPLFFGPVALLAVALLIHARYVKRADSARVSSRVKDDADDPG